MTKAFIFGFIIAAFLAWLAVAHDTANSIASKFSEWIKSFGGKKKNE